MADGTAHEDIPHDGDGAQESVDPTAVAEALELVQRADGLRARLLSQRSALLSEVRKIDELIGQLPGAKPAAKASAESNLPTIGRNTSIPDLLYSIIRNSDGLTAAELTEAAQRVRRKTQSRDVFANIWRLKKRGLVRAEGARGSQKYVATATNAEGDVTS